MTRYLLSSVFFLFSLWPLQAQVKWYVDFGTSFNSSFYTKGFYTQQFGNSIWTRSGSYISHPVGQYFIGDLQAEFRLNKLLYGVTGINVFQLGYSNFDQYGTSKFQCTYVGIPFVLRVNFVQAVFLDVGVIGRFPVSARLSEEALPGTVWYKTAEGNIAEYLNPFSLGFNLRAVFLFNRYSVGIYLMSGKVNVDESFKEAWGLSGAYASYSLFQEDMFPTYSFNTAGFLFGIRL